MQYHEAMARCNAYIEANLDRVITAQELADLTGYSLYHFCHVFRAYTGAAVGEYLRHLRLRRAADALRQGVSVTRAAADSGYDSHAAFTRAFRRVYGMSPTEYRRQSKGAENMNVTIGKKDAIYAIGYTLKPAEDREIDTLNDSAFWQGQDFSNLPQYPFDSSARGEVGLWYHPAEVSGALSYFFGPVTDGAVEAPAGFDAIVIPAAEYAMFEVPAADTADGLAAAIRDTWKYVFKQWFGESAYVFDETKMCFEFYHGEKTWVYIPVKAK